MKAQNYIQDKQAEKTILIPKKDECKRNKEPKNKRPRRK